MEKEQYQILYNDFMTSYTLGAVSGEQVGLIIAQLAGVFSNYNLMSVQAERVFSVVAKENANLTDEATGKNISSAKAEVLSAATNEAFLFKQSKAHVTNLEVLIGALKFLQKGLLQEFNQGNLS